MEKSEADSIRARFTRRTAVHLLDRDIKRSEKQTCSGTRPLCWKLLLLANIFTRNDVTQSICCLDGWIDTEKSEAKRIAEQLVPFNEPETEKIVSKSKLINCLFGEFVYPSAPWECSSSRSWFFDFFLELSTARIVYKTWSQGNREKDRNNSSLLLPWINFKLCSVFVALSTCLLSPQRLPLIIFSFHFHRSGCAQVAQ